uniref:BHLH domain-containing protein n=1 Tax=Nelumbo nucifera TaxID=4432 RepID=A0A822ZIE2_NELNU|nr:TPA_asm: hypothetical protein HUJ06_002633 [Nelumbo nucifera]
MMVIFFFRQTAAFMGCKSGEIEIGTSTDPTEINMEMEMRKFFPAELHQLPHFRELPHQHDQSHPSSSSSSLRSLSVNSPEYSSILFNMPSTSSMPGETLKEVPIDQKAIKSISTGILPHQQTGQAFPWLRSIQHPTPESDDAAMTRAMLAVISSPSSSSSYQSQQQQQPPPYNYKVMNQRWSAFKRYRQSALQPNVLRRDNLGRKNMLKRAIAFLKSLELKRVQEQMQGIRTTSNQLHHMISERKRREKLNESFHALRSLLPPGFKKDKASVLSSTREYLNALKAQVLELQQKNQLLEARLSPEKEVSEEGNTVTGSPGRRVDIRVTHAAESASEEREIDLQVTVLQDCDLLELSIRLLESLKQITDVSLVSMEAHTQMQQTGSYNRVTLRLNIKGSEWDESAFREAIDKVVADVAP